MLRFSSGLVVSELLGSIFFGLKTHTVNSHPPHSKINKKKEKKIFLLRSQFPNPTLILLSPRNLQQLLHQQFLARRTERQFLVDLVALRDTGFALDGEVAAGDEEFLAEVAAGVVCEGDVAAHFEGSGEYVSGGE